MVAFVWEPNHVAIYGCTVHSEVHLINTPKNAHKYMLFNKFKFTLKQLKRSYMFRSHDNPQGAYIVPC